jgi:Flp pilus assembly protein TadD
MAILTCLFISGCASGEVAKSNQMSAVAREHVAAAAEASGDTALALSMYAAAAEEAPRDAAAQLRYADILMRNGKVPEARKQLAGAIAGSNDPTAIRLGLGALDVLCDQPADGIAAFDGVLASDPNNVRALVDKAVALDIMGRHADAQPLYRRAQVVAPDDAAIANNLALSIALGGRIVDAEQVIKPFIASDTAPPRLKTTIQILADAASPEASASESGDIARYATAIRARGIQGQPTSLQ